MKKIYLIATGMVFGSVAFGQVQKNLPVQNADENPYMITDKIINTPFYNFSKAPGDVIYSEDFNGDMGGFTVTPGTMDTIWKFDLNGPDGQYSSTTNADIITSTTAANGFLMFDADFSNIGNNPFINRVGAVTSPVIDMTGITNAIISYENRYRTCCGNDFFLKVQVSTDDFATSQTFNAHRLGQGVNADLGTFETKISIGSFLATATNLSNFKFRFFFDGNEGGNTSHYFWQVDDVKIYENWTTDNSLTETFMEAGIQGIPYYNMTVNQISPITFGGSIRNNGTVPAAGTVLTTTVSGGGTGTTASTPISIAVDAMDTVFTAPWTPTATGAVVYNFAHAVTATATDGSPSDNAATDMMNITTSEYSVHNGTNGGAFTNLASQPGSPIACGNIMDIINNDNIVSMSIALNSTATNVGQVIKGLIYKFDAAADDYVYFAETEQVEIGTTGYANNTVITLNMAGGYVPVSAGDDLLVMQSNEVGVSVRTAQRVQPGVVAGVTSAGTFSLANPRALRVSLNLNPSASLDEKAEDITIADVSPNPTNNNSVLNFTARTNQEVTIQVVDVTGKIMQTEELGTITAGGHTVNINSSNFNAGIYFVNIVTNDSVVTKKLIRK